MTFAHIFKVACFSFGCATHIFAQKTTTFEVEIAEYAHTPNVKLFGWAGENYFLADSTNFDAAGKARFQRTEGFDEGLYFLVLPDGNNFQLLIANAENGFKLKTHSSNFVWDMEVENSLENTLLYEGMRYQMQLEANYNQIAQQLQNAPPPQYADLRKVQDSLLADRDKQIAILQAAYPRAFYTKFKVAGQNPRLRMIFREDGTLDSAKTMSVYRRDAWDNVDFDDARLLRTPVFINKMKGYLTESTPQIPDSIKVAIDFLVAKSLKNNELYKFVVNYAATLFKPSTSKLMDAEAVYAHTVLNYFTPERLNDMPRADLDAVRQRAKDMEASFLGKIGQNVQARNAKNELKSLYDIKAEAIIVFIYNPDCSHCKEETPKIKALYEAWQSKGLAIFSIAANETNYNRWQDFAKKYGVNWVDVWDPRYESRYYQKYFIDNTPEIYILDKNYRIVAKNLKPEQIEEVLNREIFK